MVRENWRPVAVILAILAVIIGGASSGKEEAQSREGVQTQVLGSSVQRIGETPLFAGSRRGLTSSGTGIMETQSRAVSSSLGKREVDKQDLQPGLESDSSAPGKPTSIISPSGCTGRVVPRIFDNVARLGTFVVTAYTAGYESTQKKPGQKGYGITYSGTTVEEGRTIAADLSVLPVGTRIYIEDVGERTVEDKGGGVKGKHIDLYIADLDEALDWGKQKKDVYVIEWGEKKDEM